MIDIFFTKYVDNALRICAVFVFFVHAQAFPLQILFNFAFSLAFSWKTSAKNKTQFNPVRPRIILYEHGRMTYFNRVVHYYSTILDMKYLNPTFI
jgi:hypothetical protein